MPSFLSKLKGAFTSPSNSRKAKSTGDLSYSPQVYIVKEKDVPKLHSYAWKGSLDKVTELCRPDKINVVDKEGRTALHLAVAGNHIEVVERLLTEDAKIIVFDRENRSPLIIAALNGNPRIMELLLNYLDQKNLVNLPDKHGLNVLFYSIKNPNGLPILRLLCQKDYVNLSAVDKDRKTALHLAIIQKNYDAIQLLLENGADIDAQDADSRTPLMLAALSGDEQLTEYLLDYGADKNIRDNSGKTAVEWSELSRNEKCTSLLKQNRPKKTPSSKGLKRYGSVGNDISLTDNAMQSSDGKKKFENIFSGKAGGATSNDAAAQLIQNFHSPSIGGGGGVGSKYAAGVGTRTGEDADSDTSKIVSDEKIVLSHDKSDKNNTWNDDDDDDSQNSENDSSFDENPPNQNPPIQKQEKFDSIFKGLKSSQSEENKFQAVNALVDDRMFGETDDWIDLPTNEQNNILNSNSPATFNTFFPAGKPKENEAPNWTIFVHTSNVKGAGTDANVYIQIFGTKSASARIPLERKSNQKGMFEVGNCDKFDKNLPNIGDPVKIKIGHDNKGMFAGWHLEKVILQNNITNKKFLFKCGRWLAKDELDHKIELELPVDNNNGPDNSLGINKQSTSSWNSSEDEDSLSLGSKKNPQSPRRSNLLNQIDEENEDLKKPKQNQHTLMVTNHSIKMPQQGPPQISDFEESGDDDMSNRNNNLPGPNQSAISFLIKSAIPKTSQNFLKENIPTQPPPPPASHTDDTHKNETLKQLISSTAPFLPNKSDNKKTTSDKLSEFSDSDDKSHSIDALIKTVDGILEGKNNNTTTTTNKNEKNVVPEENLNALVELVKTNLPKSPPGFGNNESKSDINSPNSTHSNETISKLFNNKNMFNVSSNEKGLNQSQKAQQQQQKQSVGLSLADKIKQERNSKKTNDFNDESDDSEFRSHSIKDLAAVTAGNILTNQKSKLQSQQQSNQSWLQEPTESSIEYLLKNNLPATPSGFGNNETSIDLNKSNSTGLTATGLANQSVNQDVSLSSLLRKEFQNKSNMFIVEQEISFDRQSEQNQNNNNNSIHSTSSTTNKNIPSSTTPGLSDLLREEFKNKSNILIQTDSLGQRESDQKQLVINQNKFNKFESSSSISNILNANNNNNNIQQQTTTPGLSNLLRNEFKNNKNEFFGSSIDSRPSNESSSTSTAAAAAYKQNQTISSLFNKNIFSSVETLKNEPPLPLPPPPQQQQSPNLINKNMPALVPSAEKSSNQTIRELLSNTLPQQNSSIKQQQQHQTSVDSTNKLEMNKTYPTKNESTTTKNNNGIENFINKINKPLNTDFNFLNKASTSFDDDDDEDEDDFDNESDNNNLVFVPGKTMTTTTMTSKEPELSTSGTIGTGIGTIIGHTPSSPLANNHLTYANKFKEREEKRSKTSFADLPAELFDVKSPPKTPKSERKNSVFSDDVSSFSAQQQLKSKQDEIELIKKQVDDMRKKNNDLANEKHELEQRLKESESKKKSFEQVLQNTEKILNEKEKQIMEMNSDKIRNEMTIKNESNEIKHLQKQIADLKESNMSLENKLAILQTTAAAAAVVATNTSNSLRSSEDFAQPLISQNESLTLKVKALEAQIDELNKDRKQLSAYKEELSLKLDETENDVRNRNEALQIATLQFNMEKKSMLEENTKAKNELNELNETKKRLKNEVESLKSQLSEKTLKYEQLNLEKMNYERQFGREKDDNDKLRKNNDSEINLLKDQLLKLNEKLSISEAKLISAENEAKYTKSQIEERQKQIDELKQELAKSKTDFALHLNLFKKEKEEKENLIKKCESLEESIRKNIEEITMLKAKQQQQQQQQPQQQTNKYNILNEREINLNSLPPPSPSPQSGNTQPSRDSSIEKENRKLQDDVKNLNEKLFKTENELEKIKVTNFESSNLISRANSIDAKSVNNRIDSKNQESEPTSESSKLKNEIQRLRNEFNMVLSKYSEFENENLNLNERDNDFMASQIINSRMQQSQRDMNMSRARRDRVDLPALITDLPLKTIANLNNYLIKNIISQEQEQLDNHYNLISASSSSLPVYNLNEPTKVIITRGNNLYATSADAHTHAHAPAAATTTGAATSSSIQHPNLVTTSPVCTKCLNGNKPYMDSLKQQLSRKIELEVAKEMPYSNLDYTTTKLNNTSRIMASLSHLNQIGTTDNFDSFYNTMSLNSRLSTQNNEDLLNSLRSKFLI